MLIACRNFYTRRGASAVRHELEEGPLGPQSLDDFWIKARATQFKAQDCCDASMAEVSSCMNVGKGLAGPR
jgi:hypothetical protein